MLLLDLFQRVEEIVEIVYTFFCTLLYIVKYGKRRLGGGGLVKIPVNIWCMVDWILTQNCRNTLPLHKSIN